MLAEPLTSMVEVRQSGGFDPFTLSLIDDAVRAVRGESTELHRVTLRMLRVTRGDDRDPGGAAPGFGYPMLTTGSRPRHSGGAGGAADNPRPGLSGDGRDDRSAARSRGR